jgi:MscS family membrane protein
VIKRFRFTRVLAVGISVASIMLIPDARAQNAEIAHGHLRPVDTSSPREALHSFLHHFDASVVAWRAGDETARRRSASMASASLDFSEDPPRGQYIRSFEKMAMLKEILDHIELPPYEQIPGKEQVEAEDISHWTIPRTLIDIVKIETGPNAGEFLISKESVANLPRYYELVKDLPYRPAKDVGLYEELRVSPGPLIPKRWIDGLPGWTKMFVFGYPLWQWATLLAALALAAVLVRWLFRWGRAWDDRVARRAGRFRFGLPLALLGTILAAWLFRRVVMDAIWLFGIAYHLVSFAAYTVMFACGVTFVIVVTDHLGTGFMQQRDGHKHILDPALTRILFRLLGIVVASFIVIYAAEFFGMSIAPLVAGLGVGGLAIALAIRPTLENILGGLTMFADRPVRVGDFCRYGSEVGTVHEIGLRSTRIRSLERTLVTIPNAEFSQMKLENFGARDTRLLRTTLQLRYETTMDQLRYVLAELRKLLLAHPMVTEAPARVRFVDFGDYSLNVEIFAYLRCQDQNTNLAIREDILFRVAGIVKESGTEFAFPTQTVHVGRDEGLNEERSKRSETTVDTWRKSGTLPFPEFDNDVRREIEDRLDYPPEGSSQNKPRG